LACTLYFLRPLLRLALALMWIISGIVGLLEPASVDAAILTGFGFVGASAAVATGPAASSIWVSAPP